MDCETLLQKIKQHYCEANIPENYLPNFPNSFQERYDSQFKIDDVLSYRLSWSVSFDSLQIFYMVSTMIRTFGIPEEFEIILNLIDIVNGVPKYLSEDQIRYLSDSISAKGLKKWVKIDLWAASLDDQKMIHIAKVFEAAGFPENLTLVLTMNSIWNEWIQYLAEVIKTKWLASGVIIELEGNDITDEWARCMIEALRKWLIPPGIVIKLEHNNISQDILDELSKLLTK